MAMTIRVLFKGATHSLAFEEGATVTIGALQATIERELGVRQDAQRLFQQHKRVDCDDSARAIADACDATQPLVLMAGASKQQIEAMKMAQDAVQTETRRRESRRVVDISKRNQELSARHAASTQFKFHGIEPLKQFKDGEKAREILDTLANDRGILAVMAKHKWSVGVLAEMPPDGKVGVDPVCVLGLNQNKGQKILLRLRTDDLLGFRKFLSIKKVLFHELSHNVHSEHDSKFYQLMRQVEKECNELDWTSSHGASVGGARVAHYDGDDMEKSRSSGHRLGGGSAGTSRLLTTIPAPPTVLQQVSEPKAEVVTSVSSQLTEEDKESAADSRSEDVEMQDAGASDIQPLSAFPSHEVVPEQVPSPESKIEQHERTVDEEVATLAMSDRERRIHDAVRHLQTHYSADTITKSVLLLHRIISNIITHPADAKFRSIRKANRLFEGQVARFPECLEFLLALGFEDQSDKFVLVREDPALLWIGRSTLEVLLPAAA